MFLASFAPAQLKWERADIELKAEAGAQELKADYPFTNAGKYPLTIVTVRPSCDCTAATLDKKLYQPGESGVLKVVFKPGMRQGLQQKQILVETDETSNNQTVLTLKTDIPWIVKTAKPFVYWTKGEETREQTIEVTMAKPVKLVSVRMMGGLKVDAQIREVKANERYTLALKPQSTAQAGMVTLELVTDPKEGIPTARVRAMVQPDKPATRPAKEEKKAD